MTRIGSGAASRKGGRGAPGASATGEAFPQAGLLSAGTCASARSGIWLARGTRRKTRSGAQAVGEAIDEQRRIAARRTVKAGPERILMRAAAFHLQRRQHQHVDAEAGIELRQLLLEQRHEMRGHAAGKAHAGARLGHRPVGAVERERNAARSQLARIEAGAQLLRQPSRLGLEAGGRDERVGPRALHEQRRRLDECGCGLRRAPQRLIETAQHRLGGIGGAEAPLQGGARHAVELADAAQAEPLQKQHRLRREPQGLDGQVREPLRLRVLAGGTR